MKEKEDDSLMKSRSARSVVAAAFRLFSGNFRRLFRVSWLSALIYALINSVLGTVVITRLVPMSLAIMADSSIVSQLGMSFALLYLFVFVLGVVGGLAELMFYSVGIDMLGVHSATGTMPLTAKRFPLKTYWRTLKAALSLIAIEIPFVVAFVLIYHYKLSTALVEPSSHVVLWTAFSVAVIVVSVLQLPLLYAVMRYLMQGDFRFWQSLPGSYKSGFSHIGHIFVVVLINAIILIVAHYVITQPAVILEMANAQSQLGAAMGDPSGMPSYMAPLCLVTFLLAGFIQVYIRLTFVFSLYYMYGAIETSEAEKKQFKTNIE